MNVGIIAAIPDELKPLVSGTGWTRETVTVEARALTVYRGPLRLSSGQEAQAWACAAGMGAGPAVSAVAGVRAAAGAVDAWISFGWAGALTCGVKPSEVYVVNEVIDAKTGERWPTDTPHHDGPLLRAVTLDHVALAHEKRPLAERYRAVLVDMEGATVARLAAAQGVRFYSIKGISDGYTDHLPDFNRFITPQGSMRMASFVTDALLHPKYWRPLARLRTQSAAAGSQLAAGVAACFERSGLVS